jgi:hypothetical protein
MKTEFKWDMVILTIILPIVVLILTIIAICIQL